MNSCRASNLYGTIPRLSAQVHCFLIIDRISSYNVLKLLGDYIERPCFFIGLS